MKVFNDKNSKERFIEVFQRVNKLQLNEDFGMSINPNNTLNVAFEQLKTGQLKVLNSNTQTKGDESYVALTCTDNQNNQITFTFKLVTAESDQEGVFDVGDVVLTEFSFDDIKGAQHVDMEESALKQFNSQHSAELYDIVSKYVDIEAETPAYSDEELVEAIKVIDAIKKDSMPYAGDFEKMVTGKDYVDQKPVNSAIRTNDPSLDNIVMAEAENFIKMYPNIPPDFPAIDKQLIHNKRFQSDEEYYNTFPPQKKAEYTQKALFMLAEKHGVPPFVLIQQLGERIGQEVWKLIKPIVHDEMLQELNESKDYPDPIGKEFKPETSYPEKRKKHTKKVKIKRPKGAPKPITINEEYEEDDIDVGVDVLDIPVDKIARKQAFSDIRQDVVAQNRQRGDDEL